MSSSNSEPDYPSLLSRLREAFAMRPTRLDVAEHLVGQVERNIALLKLMREHADNLTAKDIHDRHGGSDAVNAALCCLHELYLERYEERRQEACQFYDQELQARTEASQCFLNTCNDPRFVALRESINRDPPTAFRQLPRTLGMTSEQVVALLLLLRQAFLQRDKEQSDCGPSPVQGE